MGATDYRCREVSCKPEDARFVYEHTDAAGFVGVSSIERIRIYKAIKEVGTQFKFNPPS